MRRGVNLTLRLNPDSFTSVRVAAGIFQLENKESFEVLNDDDYIDEKSIVKRPVMFQILLLINNQSQITVSPTFVHL